MDLNNSFEHPIENKADEDLMHDFANGQYQAFETLYTRHKGALYRYVTRLVSDRSLAEDLYQDVWSRIIKAADTYQVKNNAKWTTWAYTIAHNIVVDHYKAFKPVVSEGSVTEGIMDVASHESPDRAHAQAEVGSQLHHCLDKLPATQREVFLLSQETDLNLKTVSEVVDASHEAVKTRLRYARNALKECLARFGIVSSQSSQIGEGQ